MNRRQVLYIADCFLDSICQSANFLLNSRAEKSRNGNADGYLPFAVNELQARVNYDSDNGNCQTTVNIQMLLW